MKLLHRKCPCCLGEGKLVKIGDFGELIYKVCDYCRGDSYCLFYDYPNKYDTERIISKNLKKGFKAINSEYYLANDVFGTLKVRRKK